MLLALIAGCASSGHPYSYTRPGATQQDISRDTFECVKEVQEIHKNDVVWGPGWYVSSQGAKLRRVRADQERLYMEGKGFTATPQ